MIGQTISHYTILEKLGEGGMGVVYKARDTKLDRDVALKFLPQQLAASEADRARFAQEAKAAAALNHPNVCSIIDIQEHEAQGGATGATAQMFIVMEFVDGQTLREMTAGQATGTGAAISLKQAVDIGIQVADGLAAAHEKGIVHRDVKPENIMIRRDGIAQVMDFGLAKLRASGSKITRLTKQGSTVGTAGYMSPEQVTGQEADHRSDIFSLGVLLYELFTGELPFKGVHETALAYEIVNVDPAPMSVIRPALDPSLDAIVLECLAKEKTERFQSVAEVAKELRKYKRESSRQSVSRISAVRAASRVSRAGVVDAGAGVPGTASAGPARSGLRTPALPWALAALFLAAAAVLAWMKFPGAETIPEEVRLSLNPPEGTTLVSGLVNVASIAPDGRSIAFLAADTTGTTNLYLRSLRDEVPRKLPGTEAAYSPFWSPDNRSIAFFSRGKLKRIDVDGGAPLTICNVRAGRGGTWNTEGTIIFAGDQGVGLSMVRATGGEVTSLTALDTADHESTHRWPWFLPDGRHYLYFVRVGAAGLATDSGRVYLGSIGSTERTLILQAATNAEFGGGHLFYLQERTLMARRFDPGQLSLVGDPFALAEDVTYAPGVNKGGFSVSNSGDFVYNAGIEAGRFFVTWFDRTGKNIGTVGERGRATTLRLSPEGTRLAVEENDEARTNRDIWIHDLRRGIRSRLTFDAGNDMIPVWTPDGRQVIFTSNRTGVPNFYRKNAEGIGSDEPLFVSDVTKRATSISGDGRTLFYFQKSGGQRDDLYALPLVGDPKPVPVVVDDFDKDYPAVSPDGKWVSYASNETGTYQIYVVPYPPTGGRWQISSDQAFVSVWAADGKSIYYTTAEEKLMVTAVSVKGGALEVGKTETLFSANFRASERPFDVSADGSRIVAIVNDDPGDRMPLTVVLNWKRPGVKE